MRRWTYHWHGGEGSQVLLAQLVDERRRDRHIGFDRLSAAVAQDGRVDAPSEVDGAVVRIRPDPVVANRLVGLELP